MPPQVLSSDSESDADVIQPKKTVTKKAASKPEDEVEEANGGDGENEEESDAADEYTVEAIMDHKFERDVSSHSPLFPSFPLSLPLPASSPSLFPLPLQSPSPFFPPAA